MRTFLFPGKEDMKKVRVKLDNPRLMEFKDGRKNITQKTLIPLKLKDYIKIPGIYLIEKEGKVSYVGATENFFQRMVAHVFLRNNPDIKFVYFFEEQDPYKRLLHEMICKYHYFNKVNVEWNYAKS